jgi:hypothetical protein
MADGSSKSKTPSRPAPALTVLVNGKEDSSIYPLSIERSAGGKRLDHAVLIRPQRPLDWKPQSKDVQEVTIKADKNVLFWGKISKVKNRITPAEDSQAYVARIEPFHFGFPLADFPVYSPAKKAVMNVDGAPLFNPLIDGQIYGNMHQNVLTKGEDATGGAKINVFLDPESARTKASQTLQTGKAVSWPLSYALAWSCFWLNGNQQYIQNPSLKDMQSVVDDAKDLVRNLQLKLGDYLPQVLDALLLPFGYSWFVQLQDEKVRQIVLFKRGKGTTQTTVKLQRPGELYDFDKTNLASAPELECDYSAAVNSMHGLADFVEVEATFYLAKGWDPTQDDLAKAPVKCARNNPANDGTHPYAWRKWVLNEAGDYGGLRPELGGKVSSSGSSSPGSGSPPSVKGDLYYDFSKAFPKLKLLGTKTDESDGIPFDNTFFVPRRRKFLPCLTLDPADGKPAGTVRGVRIQFLDHKQPAPPSGSGSSPPPALPDQYDSKGALSKMAWKDVTAECRLDEHECSVEFTGEHLPDFISPAPQSYRSQPWLVRVTATIRFDLRMSRFGVRSSTTSTSASGDTDDSAKAPIAGSLLPNLHELTLDLKERFHCRLVDKSSIYDGFVHANAPFPRIGIAASGTTSTSTSSTSSEAAASQQVYPKSLEIDDSKKLQDYLDVLRQTWDFPMVSGPLVLEGVDRTDYELGQGVTKIEGREVSLQDSNKKDALCPLIAGIQYDLQRQSTTLTLDHFRADHKFLVDAQGIP